MPKSDLENRYDADLNARKTRTPTAINLNLIISKTKAPVQWPLLRSRLYMHVGKIDVEALNDQLG